MRCKASNLGGIVAGSLLQGCAQPVLHRAAGNCLGPGADLEPCLYALQSLRKTHSDGESFCISWLRQEWLLSEKWRNGKTLKVISSPGSAILKLFWGLLVSHLVWFGNLFTNIQLGYLDQFVQTIGASKRTRGLNLPRSKEVESQRARRWLNLKEQGGG